MSFPALRFKQDDGQDFPEWKEKLLGDLCSTFKSGSGITSEQIKNQGNYPVYGGNGLRGYSDSFTHDGFFVLIGRQGALCGNINRSVGKAYISEHAIAVNANEASDTEWLAQKLELLNLNRLSESSAQPGLAVNKLIKLKLTVPSKTEQTKIANFLTAVDEKISLLTQKHDLLTLYKKGVMQQIFNQELRFKDDDGQEFPEWEQRSLGEIGKFKSGTGFADIEQGGTSGTPFYKVSDMNLAENKLEMLVANNYVSEEQINKMKYKIISDEAIVFAKVGAAIFLERKRKAKNFLIDNNMMAFIPTCEINFIKHFMDSIRLSKFAQVGALPSYNASDLSIIEIAVPCVKEQTKIANFLTAIDGKITTTQNQLQAVKLYKQGLLQQMFV